MAELSVTWESKVNLLEIQAAQPLTGMGQPWSSFLRAQDLSLSCSGLLFEGSLADGKGQL